MTDLQPRPTHGVTAFLKGLSARKKMLIAFVPFAVVLLAFAGKVFLMLGSNDAGKDAYGQSQYDQAGDQFDRNKNVNVFEDWLATFNRGTVFFQQNRYSDARVEFEKALKTVPTTYECMVRINLALTMEAQGDELRSQQRSAEAQTLYEQARTVLRDGKCGDPNKSDDGSDSPKPSTGPPSKQTSAPPSTSSTGEPTSGQSGQPTTGPSGQPTTGPTSEQERKEREQEASDQTDERLEEKKKEAEREAKDQERRESQAATRTPTGSPTQSQNPDDQQSRLDDRNKDGQGSDRDDKDRKETRSPGPTASKAW